MAKKAAKKTTTKKAASKATTTKKASAAGTTKKTASKATATKKTATKASGTKKATTKKASSGKKPNSAFMKALTVSAELAAVIGMVSAARTEVVKGLWKYIKKHNLQDPNNKRNIIADEKLRKVFGKPVVNMFEMTKLTGKHLK